MNATPLVSIVIPVFNDEEVIAGALESCLRQSLHAIEVIVVDDASTDGTAGIVQQYANRDSRVRLIKHEQNRSAFQARREGILAARAEHLLFLDGDDELDDLAGETALSTAIDHNVDLVQFGIQVVHQDGHTGGRFEARLQPRHDLLAGSDVLRELFPVNQPAQGQVWRFLYRTELLREAYALMPGDLVLPRVNDLPIAFLAAALATSYASVPNHLYRYHFGRGGSGQKVDDLDWAVFYAGAIDSINTISGAVDRIASGSAEPAFVLATYESARQSIIAYTTHYLAEHTTEDLRGETFAHLYTRAPASEIVQATARFWPRAIPTLAEHASRIDLPERPVRSVLLTTNTLRTGGVSGVLLSQARLLLQAGFRVTIAAREPGSDESAVPEGARFVEIDGGSLATELAQWAGICREHEVDVVIDHHWLYTRKWPAFALAARAEGAGTIGWAHNFAARPILLGLKRLDFQSRHMDALTQLVVLSPLDVAFWKLRGMPRVTYLPNPPSPLVLASAGASVDPKPAPAGRRIELVWWGRLEQRTKRVDELVTVAGCLQQLGIDFRLRLIGPDWSDMTAAQLAALASERGVAHRVEVVGSLHGDDLIAAIDSSDLFVNTSIIEGYPLTFPEAQSRGLPIAMYELPWLALAQHNDGIVAVPQGDAFGLAAKIAGIATDPTLYARLSKASITASRRELSYDLATLYEQLFSGTVPAEFSPEPTVHDAQQLIDLVVLFSERNAASRTRPAARRPSRSETAERDEIESTVSALVRRFAPAARTVISVAPWLRPVASRVKHTLLRH